MTSNRLAFLGTLVALGLLTGGCAGYRESRGYIMDEQLASAVQVGTDNKTSVEKTLGRPTFTGQFGDSEWYYVSRNTSTFALNNVTLPYVRAIADKGYRQACLDDPHLMAGLNVHRGRITHPAVARDLGLPYTAPEQALQAA